MQLELNILSAEYLFCVDDDQSLIFMELIHHFLLTEQLIRLIAMV